MVLHFHTKLYVRSPENDSKRRMHFLEGISINGWSLRSSIYKTGYSLSDQSASYSGPEGFMALVAFLRGVNVGGHKTFRPTLLAGQLKHLGVVNIGAAGTFVIREPVSESQLRVELARKLPFETELIICQGREILDLIAKNPFTSRQAQPDIVRFISVLSARPRSEPSMPVSFPPGARWLVKILGRNDRFVFGMYRRHMKTIRYLGAVDRLFDVPITTRNWNTMNAIAKAVGAGEGFSV